MTDEQKEKARADMERSVDRLRSKLVEVCTAAADALKEARETESLGERWGKLSAAVGKVRSMMRPEPGTLAWSTEIDWYVDHEPRLRWATETGGGATYHTPPEALDAVMGNPPFDPATGTGALPSAMPLDTQKRNLIGIHASPDALIAWNFQSVYIICDARKIDEGHWKITGRANGEERISAIVTGGRWTANCYLRAIRNGMTSRARRVKKCHANAAAKRAKAETTKETNNEH